MQQGMNPSAGGTAPAAPNGETAPPNQGGLPPTAPGAPPQAPGQIGNTTLMPGGAPAMMGMGEPMTGTEGFPLPYTPLKPFGPAMATMAGTGIHGAAVDNQASAAQQKEAMPGRAVVKADEVTSALAAAVNRKGEKATSKLKGKVYLMGEIAERGFTDGQIEIGLTVAADQQIIVTALPQWSSKNLLAFRILEGGAEPTEGVLIFGPEQAVAPAKATAKKPTAKTAAPPPPIPPGLGG